MKANKQNNVLKLKKMNVNGIPEWHILGLAKVDPWAVWSYCQQPLEVGHDNETVDVVFMLDAAAQFAEDNKIGRKMLRPNASIMLEEMKKLMCFVCPQGREFYYIENDVLGAVKVK
jgi:hypothetical protein